VQFHHATLDNGLEIVAEINDRAHSVATGFFVKTGSRDETAAISGMSHFLEHMVFKGTERRDALCVNRDFDRVGAKHNAQTSEEDTIYHATCLPEYLAPTFDVLADILRPSLRPEDFHTEKQVIIEEIRMYQDNPMMVAYDAAKALHFGEHPLGRSVLGSVESIGAMTPEQMRSYFDQRYSPVNIVLAVTGKTEWARILDLANEKCAGWQGGPADRVALPPRGSGHFQAILRDEDLQQTIVGIVDAPSLESPDRYAAQLLAIILGDSTGSRLYWELIDPGHADGVEVSYQDYNRGGAYYTFLSCDPAGATENLDRIAEVYRALHHDGPTEAELIQAQNKVMARTVLRSERPMGRLMPLGFHWSYHRAYVSVEQELDAFSAVTIADLRRLLEQWPLLPMSIVSVGPTTEVKPPD
jgi:predicted Zn-dependent peptidase